MNKVLVLIVFATFLCGCSSNSGNLTPIEKNISQDKRYAYLESQVLVESARRQIGVVTRYDVGYYQGGYPPDNSGACTDVIERALRDNGYNLKEKVDKDMEKHPERYPFSSDPNINFRRVKNVKIFFDNYAEKIPTCTNKECFEKGYWQPGDIVTFDQIPGSLWYIAIISNKTIQEADGISVPLLIHNYGRGVVEDDLLLSWPAPITGHYRVL